MRVLLDEMYGERLAVALRDAGIEAVTVHQLRLNGASDYEVFAAAVAEGFAVVTENVGDFTRIAAAHIECGDHHPGLLIALSSRFSRRASGYGRLVEAVVGVADAQVRDRTVYLQPPG